MKPTDSPEDGLVRSVDTMKDDPFTASPKPEDKSTPSPEEDIIIELAAYAWTIPAAPLVAKGEFFRALLTGGYQESTTRHVHLHDDDPLPLARLLIWSLHGTYPLYASAITPSGLSGALWRLLAPHLSSHSLPPLLSRADIIDAHLDVYVVADKYGVEELRRYCIQRVRAVMNGVEAERGLVWGVAERVRGLEGWKGELEGFVRNWLMCRMERYRDDKEFEEFVKSDEEFAWELLTRLQDVGCGEEGERFYAMEVKDEWA